MTPLAPAAPQPCRQRDPCQRRIRPDRWRIAERHAPRDVAFVQIDRDQLAVRRLHEREPAASAAAFEPSRCPAQNDVAPPPSPMKSASTSEARGLARGVIRRDDLDDRRCRWSSSHTACRFRGSKPRRPSCAPPMTPGPAASCPAPRAACRAVRAGYFFMLRLRLRLQLRRQVERIVERHALRRDRRRPGRETAASATPVRPATSLGGTGRSSIGHTGAPVTRSKTNAKPCFVSCTTASMRRPSTRHGDEHRRRRGVVVPQPVMRRSGNATCACRCGVEADQRFGEQIVAGPAAAVEIVARRRDRQVDAGRAPRRASTAPTHWRGRCSSTNRWPTSSFPDRPATASCGTSRPVCRCAHRTRARRPADRC